MIIPPNLRIEQSGLVYKAVPDSGKSKFPPDKGWHHLLGRLPSGPCAPSQLLPTAVFPDHLRCSVPTMSTHQDLAIAVPSHTSRGRPRHPTPHREPSTRSPASLPRFFRRARISCPPITITGSGPGQAIWLFWNSRNIESPIGSIHHHVPTMGRARVHLASHMFIIIYGEGRYILLVAFH